MEGKSWRYYLGIIVAIVLLLVPGVTWAAEIGKMEVEMGPAKIRASIATSVEYNNNINLKDSGKKASMVYRVTPGVTMQMPIMEKTFFLASADATYRDVAKGDTTWTGHAGGVLRYSLSNQTSLGVSHDYTKAQLYGVNSGENYQLNTSQAQIKHQFSPLTAVALFGSKEMYTTHTKSGTSIYDEYDQFGGGASIEQKVTSTTTLTLNGDYQKREFDENVLKDFNSYSGMIGVSERVAPRLTVGVQGGYTNRDYTQGTDLDEILYGADLNYIISPLSTLTLSYNHSLQDTFYSGVPETGFADQNLLNLLETQYRAIETDRLGTNLRYNLTDKDVITVGGGYIRSDSNEGVGSTLGTKLKENNSYGGLGYSRRFTSWLALDLKGTYGKRVSNVRDKYDYYTASGGFSLSF